MIIVKVADKTPIKAVVSHNAPIQAIIQKTNIIANVEVKPAIKANISKKGTIKAFVGKPGGAGTPSDSVVTETTHGQSASAGASPEYSRGDHTHGTPAAEGGGSGGDDHKLFTGATVDAAVQAIEDYYTANPGELFDGLMSFTEVVGDGNVVTISGETITIGGETVTIQGPTDDENVTIGGENVTIDGENITIQGA